MCNEEIYEILNVLEFTSSRKRMSVIVRMPDNSIKLMIKGAVNMLQAEHVVIFNIIIISMLNVVPIWINALVAICCNF